MSCQGATDFKQLKVHPSFGVVVIVMAVVNEACTEHPWTTVVGVTSEQVATIIHRVSLSIKSPYWSTLRKFYDCISEPRIIVNLTLEHDLD